MTCEPGSNPKHQRTPHTATPGRGPPYAAIVADPQAVTSQRDPAAEVADGFPVTDRPTWLMLLALAAVIATGIIWAVFGRAPDSVSGPGMLVPESGFPLVGHAAGGTVEALRIREGDAVTAGQVVATVRQADGSLVQAKAPKSGTIATVLVRPGMVTVPGRAIATILPTDDLTVAVGFLPAGPAKRVTAGMRARVALASVPQSQYGTIEGIVTSVQEVPASLEQVLLIVGDNEALAQYYLKSGPIIPVTVKLVPDSTTASGLKWTVGSGPDDPVTTGSLAEVEVVLSERAPLGRLL